MLSHRVIVQLRFDSWLFCARNRPKFLNIFTYSVTRCRVLSKSVQKSGKIAIFLPEIVAFLMAGSVASVANICLVNRSASLGSSRHCWWTTCFRCHRKACISDRWRCVIPFGVSHKPYFSLLFLTPNPRACRAFFDIPAQSGRNPLEEWKKFPT